MTTRKCVSALLAALLVLSLAVPAFAAGAVTRGEFVAALYDACGGEAEAAEMRFDDVPADGALAKALTWAVNSRVVSGYGNGKFGPDDPVTREQAAAMLYRCARTLGRGFEGAWMFELDYPDAGEISAYADEAMHWVVANDILNGTDKGLEPRAALTQAQLDTILERWQKVIGDAGAAGIDYLVLVNKCSALPEGWEDALELTEATNSMGDEIEVEKKAYDAYLALKADLAAEGIHIGLDSARRSVAAQQDIMDRFTEKYGADYAAKTVARPGYSEHHTGLALDLYLNVDGEDVYYNEDMEKEEYKGIWAAIHARLADYGFILRYLEGEEHITGYRYEPWHIRYVDSVGTAREIMSQPGLTLEEYLAGKSAPEVGIDLGSSELYTEDELYDAMLAIKCSFAAWAGCELHSLRYAGDEAGNAEKLAWLNSLGEGAAYTQAAEFLMDFHSPVKDAGAWEPDMEYTDCQWWLARTAEGGWEIVSWGY